MTGQLSGALKPDYVIPFKLDKKRQREAEKHLTVRGFCRKHLSQRIISARLRASTFRSGCMTQTQTQISVTVQQRPGSGAIVIMIIRRPAIMQYIEVVLLVLIMYRWMALPAWKMI